MNKIYRIGFLSGDKLDFGGVETHLLSIFDSLQNTEFQCFLISPASSEFIKRAKDLNVQCIGWNPGQDQGLWKILSLLEIIRENQLSLVHIHSPRVSIAGRFAACLAGVPAFITVHLQPSDYFANSTMLQKIKLAAFTFLDRSLNFMMTEKILYVSFRAFTQDIKIRYSPQKRSVLIPNRVGLSINLQEKARNDIRESMGVEKNHLVFCFVGRLEPQKGLDILIRSLPLIKSTILDTIEFWIIGSGSLQSELEHLSRMLGVNGYLRFAGYQETVQNYLKGADVFVLTSYFEARPFALLEALAYGLPCIVTETGDNAILVENGVNGFVIPVGDIHELANAITALVENPELRGNMAMAARTKVQAFSVSEMTGKLGDIYWAVLHNKNGV